MGDEMEMPRGVTPSRCQMKAKMSVLVLLSVACSCTSETNLNPEKSLMVESSFWLHVGETAGILNSPKRSIVLEEIQAARGRCRVSIAGDHSDSPNEMVVSPGEVIPYISNPSKWATLSVFKIEDDRALFDLWWGDPQDRPRAK